MTPPNPLTVLAERVQALTEACRETDALIWQLQPCELPDCLPDVKAELVARMIAGGDDSECPAYTASLDAAMTLVPEGLPILARDGYDDALGDKRPYAHVMNEIGEGYAATKALAIVVAALRARAASESPHG